MLIFDQCRIDLGIFLAHAKNRQNGQVRGIGWTIGVKAIEFDLIRSDQTVNARQG